MKQELLPRELECLRWASHGLTYQMTADVMRLSPETVKDYLEMARLKLAGKTTAHAVGNAFRDGLLR